MQVNEVHSEVLWGATAAENKVNCRRLRWRKRLSFDWEVMDALIFLLVGKKKLSSFPFFFFLFFLPFLLLVLERFFFDKER